MPQGCPVWRAKLGRAWAGRATDNSAASVTLRNAIIVRAPARHHRLDLCSVCNWPPLAADDIFVNRPPRSAEDQTDEFCFLTYTKSIRQREYPHKISGLCGARAIRLSGKMKCGGRLNTDCNAHQIRGSDARAHFEELITGCLAALGLRVAAFFFKVEEVALFWLLGHCCPEL